MSAIPASLLSAIINAAGQHLAALAAESGRKAFPIHPEDLAIALRVEAREALKGINLKEIVADELATVTDLRDLTREEVGRIVERDVDVERAFEEAREDLERDLRREAESIDLDEIAKDVVAEAMGESEVRDRMEASIAAAVDGAKPQVIAAAGQHLANAVIAAADATPAAPPAIEAAPATEATTGDPR